MFQSLVDGMTNSWSMPGQTSHGGCLTADDLDRLRELISHFCLSCLIPHVEHQINQLFDQVHSHSTPVLSRQR